MHNLPTDSSEWDYQVFDCETDPNEFGSFKSIIELWHSKRKKSQLPAWRDFKFNDFVGWYGWMSVCDISYDPVFDTRFRLWGTNVVKTLGYDLTGQSPRMNTTPPFEYSGGFSQVEFDYMETLAKQPAIGTSFGSVDWQFRSYVKYEEITIPLADDGHTVNMLWSAINPID